MGDTREGTKAPSRRLSLRPGFATLSVLRARLRVNCEKATFASSREFEKAIFAPFATSREFEKSIFAPFAASREFEKAIFAPFATSREPEAVSLCERPGGRRRTAGCCSARERALDRQ